MSGETVGRPKAETAYRVELAEARASLASAEAKLDACARDADELNHRVANSLQLAASFLLLQRKRLKDETAKEALEVASTRIAAVAKLHRHLAEQGSAPSVDLGELLRRIAPDMGSSTGTTCEITADRIEVSGEIAMQLAVAVNELVINAGKHAYGKQDGGVVHIECRHAPNDMIRLSVADGGPGLTEGFKVSGQGGLGFVILNSIIRQLGGTIAAVTDGGARFTLSTPRVPHPSKRAYSASGTP